ncbi:dihydroorotate dehydrogenase (fumarate) [Skeletonema marinoi]|uniref:Dihydroorotate dehydrogenase (Fumarate) n=1 Tax=Skeletonema marinoi TaxID=267567 RepID=A0AAD8YA86_9STRA|nr:dihydroorotate dehydrogenase (fumarate) [Skeletonema marinoi]
MVDISVTLAGVPLTSCVYNASGPRTGSSAAMSKIAKSASGGVLAKSATIASQKGNDLPRTWHEDNGKASLNSEGLPNSGIDYYIDPKTISETMGESPTKPYMVSISGKNIADNLQMLQKISSTIESGSVNIAAVELNLACPNIVGKPTIGYDFEQMEDVMKQVASLPCFSGSKPLFPLGVKMPPYFDRPHFEMAAAILNKYKHIVSYAASINTIGNALAIDYHAEMPVIRAKGGFAGLSGPAVKYTALANVKQMRELLDNSIDVVGAGGVQTGRDAFEMILCGATAVQVGTCHWTEGPGCFDRICDELKAIMKDKGYGNVEDFRGKLKEWSKEGVALSRQMKMKSKKSDTSGDVQLKASNNNSSLIIAILFAIIAVLLADKLNIVSL